MKKRLVVYVCFILFFASLMFPIVSNANSFTCTIKCKNSDGNISEVSIKLEAVDRNMAVSSLIGFMNLRYSKASKICKSKGYAGLYIAKNIKPVECK